MVTNDPPTFDVDDPHPDLRCPWCDSQCVTQTRTHDTGTEFKCLDCGECHTRKVEEPGSAFLAFPPDIEAAANRSFGLIDPATATEIDIAMTPRPRPPDPPPDPLAVRAIRVYHYPDDHPDGPGLCDVVLMTPDGKASMFTVTPLVRKDVAEDLAAGYRRWLSGVIRAARAGMT